LKRFGLTIAAAVTMLSLTTGSASAATEVGNNCVAITGGPDLTVLQLSKSGGPSNTVPGAGVVTKWRVNWFAFEKGAVPTQMRVFREAGGTNRFTTVAESEIEEVGEGTNEFDTRIPVQAGDRFGAYGTSSESVTPFCVSADEGNKAGIYEGNAGVGQTQTYEEFPGLLSPILATVEPDVDNDGYGDETQDLCPASAAVHTVACPIITLGSYGMARKNAALILATSSSTAAVTVSGVVNVPRRLLVNKRGKRKGKGARSSALVRLNGGTKVIAGGQFAFYRLKFTRQIRKALRKLPRKAALTLHVTTSTTDVAGRPSSSTVKVKLRGQKPKNKKRGKGKRKGKRN